jgi:3-hydroxyacyl-[acyl-carrier-protein] dehydratase
MTMRDSISAARISGPMAEADGSTVFEFRFGSDNPTFAGHFPGQPILPGVFQLEMTRAAAEWVLHCSLDIREITKAKFLRPIMPHELVRLNLKCLENASSIQLRAVLSVLGQPAGETIMAVSRRT